MWWMTGNTSMVSVTFSTLLTNEFVAQIALIGISAKNTGSPTVGSKSMGSLSEKRR